MKFNKQIDKLLKKYPLNEDFGNLFGTLGNFVKKHAKEIAAPMTDPFKGLIRKTDLSQGDGILEEVREALIKTPEVFNKQLYFLNKGNPAYYDKSKKALPVSYKQLDGLEELTIDTDKPKLHFNNKPVVDEKGNPVFEKKDVKPIIKEIIKYIDLNSYNLVDRNKSLLLQKIQEVFQKRKEKKKEYGEEQDPLKSDMSPERVYKRFLYLTKNEIFVTKPKGDEEKIKWLYILAKPNDKFDYAGALPQADKQEQEEKTQAKQNQQKPQQQNKPKTGAQPKPAAPTAPAGKPQPTAAPAVKPALPATKPNTALPAPRTNPALPNPRTR